MKLSTALLASLLIPLLAAADPVTRQQALQRAQQFMPGKTFATATVEKRPDAAAARGRDHKTTAEKATEAFYVLNAQEGGYVVVSGDDRTPTILGYSQNREAMTNHHVNNKPYDIDKIKDI